MDAGAGADGGVSTAFHEAAHWLPSVPFNGGPVLAAPTIVTVTFADDPNRAADEAFDRYVAGSSWLADVGAEYGVGDGREVPAELPSTSPAQIDDTGVQNLLAGLLQDGGLPGLDQDGGAPSDGGVQLESAVYVLYFPPSTAVSLGGQPLCTASSGGYHGEAGASGRRFAYAVVGNCPDALPVSPTATLEWTASHEIIEACTDPFPESHSAWAIADPTAPWGEVGGEVGDLCSFLLPQWSADGHTLQRVWSNASASDGGSPCLPAAEPYYGADVEPSGYVAADAGSNVTFTVTGWSTAPVPDFYLYAAPYAGSFKPTLTPGTTYLNNGGATTLTVGIPAGTPSGSYALAVLEAAESQNDFTGTLVGVYVP